MSGKNIWTGAIAWADLLHSIWPKYAMLFWPIMLSLSIWITPIGMNPWNLNLAIWVAGWILGFFWFPLTIYGILIFLWKYSQKTFLIMAFIGFWILIFSLLNVSLSIYEYQKKSLNTQEDCSSYSEGKLRYNCVHKIETAISAGVFMTVFILIFIGLEIIIFKAIIRKDVRQLLDIEISKK